MKAGKHSQAENSHINGRKIVAGVVRDAGREHDGSDSSDLDGGIELAHTINAVTSMSLSAMGSRTVPSCDCCPKRRANNPSRPSVNPARMKTANAKLKRR